MKIGFYETMLNICLKAKCKAGNGAQRKDS